MTEDNSNNGKYVTLKVPKGLADEIDQLIKSGTLGYRSRTEMVKHACYCLVRSREKKIKI